MKKMVWFAKGGGIAKSGPHKDPIEAAAAMTLINGQKPDNFAIWPEYIQEKKGTRHGKLVPSGR